MFLIDAIKPNIEKKSKTFFILMDCLGEGSFEFIFYVRFSGGNKNIIQKKQENKKNKTQKIL
jgi:hypothetical protein